MIIKIVGAEPAFRLSEARRYAGCRQGSPEIDRLIRETLEEVRPVVSYTLCYTLLPVVQEPDNRLCIGPMSVRSGALSKALHGCDSALLLASTLGVGIDRLILRYSRLEPSKSVILQGIGAERIESFLDAFCQGAESRIFSGRYTLRPRVSPGYGDIPLAMQTDIFSILDCNRLLGLTLNAGFLMSPSKSVTAIAGISHLPENQKKNESRESSAER